ncbi:MAG: alkaline phosphatase family protein [Methylomicrobium sp.]
MRFPDLILSLVFSLILVACTPATRLLLQGGVESERSLVRAHRQGPYVLIFALDGVGYDQMMTALKSGATPWLSALLGVNQGDGVFAHAYSIPDAVSVLPSTTIPGWTSIFTGKAPAYTGIPGNEWFVREEMRFLAPVPVSFDETDDTRRAISADLVGKALKGQTLFDWIEGPVFISLNYMHHGADLFTTNDPPNTAALAMAFKTGKLVDSIPLLQKSYEELDRNSVPKVVETIRKHGVPTLQVVYFPGIDLFTHIAKNPLDDQVGYLKTITFPLIEAVLVNIGIKARSRILMCYSSPITVLLRCSWIRITRSLQSPK